MLKKGILPEIIISRINIVMGVLSIFFRKLLKYKTVKITNYEDWTPDSHVNDVILLNGNQNL